MEKIESYRQFSDIVKAFKKKGKEVRSNCFFLPEEVRKMTEKGTLYLEQTEDCLNFFVSEAGCRRLYYYRNADAVPMAEKKDTPVFLDFVYREVKEAALNTEITAWENQGFWLYKKYRRMECMGKDFIPPADEREMEKTYPVQVLLPSDYEDCIALWESCLDVYSTLLPDKEEFDRACDKGEIMGVRLKDGRVGAVDRGIFKGRTAFMQHLSVSHALRGQGLGRTLCCASIGAMFTQYGVEKVNFWVDEKNTHAIGIYERMGFVNDGMISVQLKMNKKTEGVES